MEKVRKEIWLEPSIFEILKQKAKALKKTPKAFIEDVVNEVVRGDNNFSVVVLRKYFNEITEEVLSSGLYMDEAKKIAQEALPKIEAEIGKKRKCGKPGKLLDFMIYGHDGSADYAQINLYSENATRGGLWFIDRERAIPHK